MARNVKLCSLLKTQKMRLQFWLLYSLTSPFHEYFQLLYAVYLGEAQERRYSQYPWQLQTNLLPLYAYADGHCTKSSFLHDDYSAQFLLLISDFTELLTSGSFLKISESLTWHFSLPNTSADEPRIKACFLRCDFGVQLCY